MATFGDGGPGPAESEANMDDDDEAGDPLPDELEPDEVEDDGIPADLRDELYQLTQEQLAERSLDLWWREDVLEIQDSATELTVALDLLVGAGCSRAGLLDDLREVASFADPYFGTSRRTLTRLINATTRLAEKFSAFEPSRRNTGHPPIVTSEMLRREVQRFQQIRDEKPPRNSTRTLEVAKNRLIGSVHRHVRPGAITKRRIDQALTTLLGGVRVQMSAAAIRGVRSRLDPTRPRAQKPDPKRRPAKKLLGSKPTSRRSYIIPSEGLRTKARKGA